MTERRERDEQVSLHGLDQEEALRALLAVKPDDEPAQDEDRGGTTGSLGDGQGQRRSE